jgi:hypothetical protein
LEALIAVITKTEILDMIQELRHMNLRRQLEE